jgi:hypothetical protein
MPKKQVWSSPTTRSNSTYDCGGRSASPRGQQRRHGPAPRSLIPTSTAEFPQLVPSLAALHRVSCLRRRLVGDELPCAARRGIMESSPGFLLPPPDRTGSLRTRRVAWRRRRTRLGKRRTVGAGWCEGWKRKSRRGIWGCPGGRAAHPTTSGARKRRSQSGGKQIGPAGAGGNANAAGGGHKPPAACQVAPPQAG